MNLIKKLFPKKPDPKPVKFAEANFTFKKPASMTEEQCGDLPCFRSDQHTISCWQFPLRDRITFLFTGRLWLYLLMNGHPPVSLMADSPFQKREAPKKPLSVGFVALGVVLSIEMAVLIYFVATL